MSSLPVAVLSTTFLSLPSELRNRIYELVLFHEEPIDPRPDYYRVQSLTPGLLCANKVVHREASSIFYGQNRFNFAEATPKDVDSFLERIGGKNAGSLRHVLIDFPGFICLDPGDVTLKDDSACILATIQTRCTNLSTLTTSLYSTSDMESRLDNLENHNITAEALKLVDTRFRAISSIEEIIVEVYGDDPSGETRRIMCDYGWRIITTILAEEDWGRDFSDFDGGDFDYDDGYDDGGADYDIDNDSDFWRRAAD